MIEKEKSVEVVRIKKFPDGTFGYTLSNNAVYVGKYGYLKKLLKDRYGIII